MAEGEVVKFGVEVVAEETVAMVTVPEMVVVAPVEVVMGLAEVLIGLAEVVEVFNAAEEEGEVKRPWRWFIRQSHLPDQ